MVDYACSSSIALGLIHMKTFILGLFCKWSVFSSFYSSTENFLLAIFNRSYIDAIECPVKKITISHSLPMGNYDPFLLISLPRNPCIHKSFMTHFKTFWLVPTQLILQPIKAYLQQKMVVFSSFYSSTENFLLAIFNRSYIDAIWLVDIALIGNNMWVIMICSSSYHNKKTTLFKINNNEKGFIQVKETIQASHRQWNI
jgi:hypothetical protein